MPECNKCINDDDQILFFYIWATLDVVFQTNQSNFDATPEENVKRKVYYNSANRAKTFCKEIVQAWAFKWLMILLVDRPTNSDSEIYIQNADGSRKLNDIATALKKLFNILVVSFRKQWWGEIIVLKQEKQKHNYISMHY